jgi:hypothetical protein
LPSPPRPEPTTALATLLEAVQPTHQDTLVFLGDDLDRGPDSRGVVEQVVALAEGCTVVLELDVPRSWLRRSARKRVWYCPRDIPPHHIKPVLCFAELAGASAEE